ncbi:MAG: hypothetical protein ACP5H2_11675 [Solirubrobacteraceae bacterium]
MGKTDLPRETRRETLDYGRLITTLDSIDGESVVVRLSTRKAHGEASPGVASIVGQIRHQVPSRYEGDEFSIGSPYPDRYPEHLAGGVLFLSQETFQSATLTTFDGNDYFIICIETCCTAILIQDSSSTYP